MNLTPIMSVSDHEAAAYVGDELTCHTPIPGAFTSGRAYPVTHGTYAFQDAGASGSDAFLAVTDDAGRVRQFMRRPKVDKWDADLDELWKIFRKPEIPTVAEANRLEYEKNLALLSLIESAAKFHFYPGQTSFLARVGVKDKALVAAEPGVGKSLAAISLIGLKDARRALIIAPQATVRKQWVDEVKKFAPWLSVFHLFNRRDYQRIQETNMFGLPPGVYLTWYEAFLTNGTRGGGPSLANIVGNQFDLIAADEGHKICHLDTLVCQAFLKLQSRFRYILTATAIPDRASDLFPMLGWLAVDDWFTGNTMNDLWPYRMKDYWKFVGEFHAIEKGGYQSPVVSMPGKLAKLIKPFVAHTTKAKCSPDYRKPERIQIRVPMSPEQRRLYDYYRELRHVTGKHPIVRRRRQISWLRDICCDPVGFCQRHNRLPLVTNPVTPKVETIIRLCREAIAKGEQAVVINSRVGLTSVVQVELNKLGIRTGRIDSTISTSKHSSQASDFKSRSSEVMLLGLRCASSHSFENAKCEIIGSLDYANGPMDQAEGRVDRINSPPGVTIYTVICEDSIEEEQGEAIRVKREAAALCLSTGREQGKTVTLK